MRVFLDTINRRFLVAGNILAILTVGPCALVAPRKLVAQEPAQQAEQQPPKLDAAALDDIVARIALYPDPLLAQVLAAATFSEQLPDAAKWAAEHKILKGDALAQAMDSAQLAFDPSVQALIAFPPVLDLMIKDLAWTQRLGDATLVQRGDVMDAVQRMRKKAQDAGNLKTTQQTTVVQSSPQVIEIQPASPTVIYVPTYNPQVVYAPAPPPPSGPSTGAVVAAAAIGFMTGVALSNNYCNSYWGHNGGFGWSSHTVIVHNSAWGRTWGNHNTYVHSWGGVNRGFYARPNAYVNTNAYRRTNVNVNRNVNVNNNVNVNRNVNVNQNANINRNANINQNVDQNVNRNAHQNQNVNRTNHNDLNTSSARGNTPQTSAHSGTFSGVQNGKSEHAAAARGKSSRRR
ncbi:MAG TPA: DUF3300 domain-containing protein [Bryobacteraceae bacterium]|nr:DUF3300 domain-containing protein [Bryobacteraceae bacterium]